MRLAAVALSLGLALVGCSSATNPDSEPGATSSSQDVEASGSGNGKSSEPILTFRPVLASGPADSGAPEKAPEQMKQAFAAADCKGEGEPAPEGKGMVACNDEGQKFLLDPAVASGLTAAEAVDFEGNWVVAFTVDKTTQRALKAYDGKDDTPSVVAFEYSGKVMEVKGVEQLVENGRSAIDGDFDRAEAEKIAETLRKGIV